VWGGHDTANGLHSTRAERKPTTNLKLSLVATLMAPSALSAARKEGTPVSRVGLIRIRTGVAD
jgi:hypothetical protein